jgi:hypothetical protein
MRKYHSRSNWHTENRFPVFDDGIVLWCFFIVCCTVVQNTLNDSMLILQPIEQHHLRMIYSCEPLTIIQSSMKEQLEDNCSL